MYSTIGTLLGRRRPQGASPDEELPYFYAPRLPEGEEVLVLKNGAFVGALDVTPRPWECLTNRQMDRQAESMHQALRSLRDGVELQIEVWRAYVSKLYFGKVLVDDPRVRELEAAKRGFLKSSVGRLLENRILFWLTWEPERRPPGSFTSNILKPRSLVRDLRKEEETRRLEEFQGHMAELASAVGGAGLEARRLGAQEMFDHVRETVNIGSSPAPVRLAVEGEDSPLVYLAGVACDQEISLGRQQIRYGDSLMRVITLKDLPDQIFAYQLKPLARLPFPCRIVLGANMVDQDKALAKHEGLYNRASALINGHLLGSGQAAKDIAAERKAGDHQVVVNALLSGLRLIPTTLTLILWAKDERTLNERELVARRAMTQEMAGSRPLRVGLHSWEVFRASLPGNEGAHGYTYDLLSPKVACLATGLCAGIASRGRVGDIPLMDREGALYPLTLMDIDKKVTSRNMLAFGETGGGKTFFTQQTTVAGITRGARVRTLDSGGGYWFVTKLFSGMTLSFSQDSRNTDHLNILGFRELNAKAKGRVLGGLELLFTKPHEGGLHPAVEGIVCEQLDKLFANLPTGEEPILSDLQKLMLAHPDPRAKDLGERMWIATKGQYADILNVRSGKRLEEEQLVYYDFHGCKDDQRLTNVLVYLAAHDVMTMAEQLRGLAGLFQMDEAWRLMRMTRGAALVEEMARRGRAQGMSTVFISQAERDFEQGDLREGLLEQCAYQVIFQSTKSNLTRLADIFRLNAAECELLDGLRTVVGEYSECFLITPHGRMVARLRVSPLHYWISTSDKLDKEAREEATERATKKSDTWQEGAWSALRWLAKTYPSGVRGARGAKQADLEAVEVLA